MFLSSIITYDGLPISSGGAHTLRARSPKAALRQVYHFLVTCADTLVPQTAFVEVLASRSFPDGFSRRLIEELTSELGSPIRRHAGSKHIAHRWGLTADQIDGYVALIDQTAPLPVDPFGFQPLTVAAAFNFHLLNPATRKVLPNQGVELYGEFSPTPGMLLGRSCLYARISGRSTVSMFLCFPFEKQTADFLMTAAEVQAALPFSLSVKGWRHWQLTKKATRYSGRRISVQIERSHGDIKTDAQ